jgi:sirohydrochlorin ferrochelatase
MDNWMWRSGDEGAKIVISVKAGSTHPDIKFDAHEVGELTEDLAELLDAYGFELTAVDLANLKEL